jgi:hypothetical protein
MSPTASRRSVVVDALRDRGLTLEDEGWTTVTREDSTTLTDVDAPLAVTALGSSRPLTVVSAIANAAHEGYVPVLVADERTETEIDPILSDPFLLANKRAGGREFFAVEDRIRLSDDSYACVGTSGPTRWREDPEEATDDPPLVLEAGGETIATLDSVDSLACPGPSVSAFQYSYARGDGGQFCVLADGRVVGRYASVSAMRTDGFRPVSLPLVPEHHVRDHGRLARATVVASVADADRSVSYRSLS